MKIHPDYKHFEVATDADAMRPRFEEALGSLEGAPVVLEQFCVPRVFPRNSGGFTVQYRMRIRGASDSSWKTLVLCGRVLTSAEPWPGWADEERNTAYVMEDVRLAVPAFPFDPVLGELAGLCTPGRVPPVLKDCYRELAPEGGDLVSCQVLGYRMERRCVVLHTLDSGDNADPRRVVVKVLKPRRARASSQNLATLAAGGFTVDDGDGITVPRLLAVNAEKGIQCMEFVQGDSLHDLTEDGSYENACRAAARALRKLHTVPEADLPEHSPQRELEQLRTWVLLGGKIFPHLTAVFEESYDAVASEPPVECRREHRTCIHRDFYDKQLLYCPDRTTVLDLDDAALGDPAQDHGNFTAHLILRSQQEPACSQAILAGKRAFEEGYDDRDAGFEVRAGWWQAATLLRLAVLYALRPRWRHLASRLAEESGAWVRGVKK